MKQIFDRIKIENQRGSTINLSHNHKTTFDIGSLVPSTIFEVLPGDVINMNVEALTRMAPLIAPIFHRLEIITDFFYIENRLLWSQWEDFISGNATVDPPTAYFDQSILQNDLGRMLQYRQQDNLKQSVLPIAAYCLTYDEWYRSQHIETAEKFIECSAGTGGSNNTYTDGNYSSGVPFKAAYPLDYLTSALPSAQVGSAVDLPLLSEDDALVTLSGTNTHGLLRKASDGTGADSAEALTKSALAKLTSSTDGDLFYDPNGTLEVSITGDVTSVENLRHAIALQAWLEKEMRSGTRYTEHLLAFWGVKSRDSRLNRPVLIGSTRQNMVISEVLTTADSGTLHTAEMAGHGISAGASKMIRYKVPDYGFIMAVTRVLPETGYYQGVDKMFTREDRFDYANPMFANLGEQAITQKEVYVTSTDNAATMDATFGYVPRFAEYRHINNKVSGEFTQDLEYWHLDRKFTSPPALNSDFIQVQDDKRQQASVAGTSSIYALFRFNIYGFRKLPKYAIPRLIG